MVPIVRSELLKMRHTFTMKLTIMAPLFTVGLGYMLSPHDFQYAAYNWWYTMILPILVAVWSASAVIREKSTNMQNIICLPIRAEKLWLGKIIALSVLLICANMGMWVFASIIGYFTAADISIANGWIGCALLILTYLWALPVIMMLANRFGYLFAVVSFSVTSVVLSTLGATNTWFLFNPLAIPARVVTPFFKMHPNGIPLDQTSPLMDTTVVVPALVISVILVFVCAWGCSKWLARGEKQDD